MVELQFPAGVQSPLKLLLIGAHADDIEIGCGATILSLLERYLKCEVRWVVLSGSEERQGEAKQSADLFLRNAGDKRVNILSYEDGYFPQHSAEIKKYFEDELKQYDPSIVFTHHRHDLHQDHRIVSELTWNTFRNHLILEYEVFKYDGDLGQPNVYFRVSEKKCKEKVSNIMQCFQSQSEKHWFTEDTFWSMLRIRGVEVASSSKYAESFYGRKIAVL